MNEQDERIRQHRKHMLHLVIDTLNIGDDREMLREARQAVESAPVGGDLLVSVYSYLAGVGCQAAAEHIKATTTREVTTYLEPIGGDPDYSHMEPGKKKKLILGFWGRRDKEGD